MHRRRKCFISCQDQNNTKMSLIIWAYCVNCPKFPESLPFCQSVRWFLERNLRTEINRRRRFIRKSHQLKMTPISVKMTSWLITRNVKYRAMTARSSLEWVKAPMYYVISQLLDGQSRSANRLTWVNQRMMIGRKNPKRPETAGGKTPEMNAKVWGDASDHSSRKGT